MDIRLLKTFLLVAKLLNITKAAAQLSFTQPAITAQIYNIENAFGAKLFERIGKKLILTEAGKSLVPYAENIVNLYDEARNVVRSVRCGEDTLRLAVSTQMINHMLPTILIELQQQIPNLFISVEVCMNIQEVTRGLLEQRYDLGFIHGDNSSPYLLRHGVMTEDLIWVASKDYIEKHPEVQKQDIGTWPVVNYTSSTVFRELFEQELKHRGIRSLIEYSDSAAIKRAVISGLGVSYLPRTLVEEEVHLGKLIPLEQGPPLKFRISLVHQKDKVFNVPVYALLLILAKAPDVDDTLKELF
jgi:DNA-binding transcriptional LysR family regulator